MRFAFVLLTAVIAASGPWLQGTGLLPCCSGEAATAPAASHACCEPEPAPEVAGCCHGEPSAVDADAPSLGCACAHPTVVAVGGPTLSLDQAVAAILPATIGEVIPPRLRDVPAQRRARGPPDPGVPSAAVTVARTTQLLI